MITLLAVCKFLLPFVAGMVSLAIHKARSKQRGYIDSHVHNERVKTAIFRLDDVVATVVKDLSQTLVDALKLATDGKLTESAKQTLRTQALAKVKEYLGQHGLAELSDLLQLAEESVVGYIQSKIEAKVRDDKSATPPAGIRLPPPMYPTHQA